MAVEVVVAVAVAVAAVGLVLVVLALRRRVLLRPAGFNMGKPPSYGKVWAAQQRLWIQGVVLDVINRVNADAKDWDSAPLKQITGLEVANPKAQDQRSAA